MYRDVIANGFAVVEKYTSGSSQPLIEQLDRANRIIAALEKKVADLTIKSIYAELQTA